MNHPDLARALRGAPFRALSDLLAVVPARVVDAAGRPIAGDAAIAGEQHPIVGADGVAVGSAIGPEARRIAALVAGMYDRACEKRDLADETLGRYKELTLLYEMSDKLSALLDLDAVSSFVVSEARRHLRARSAALILQGDRSNEVEVVAWVGDAVATDDALALRVLASGHAELLESEAMCAPLRAGERVFGVLHVAQEPPGRWTAGDLKLVTAIAANAAGAVSNARAHAERAREQALRHRVERYLSPRLTEAVAEGGGLNRPFTVAFCDLKDLYASALQPSSDPDSLVRLVEVGVALAVEAFVSHGATVDIPKGELAVGVFASSDAAVAAARRLRDALAHRGLGGLVGVGIASTAPSTDASAGLQAAVKAAAVLGVASPGRILVDADPAPGSTVPVRVGNGVAFEVVG